ncbi:hypothetical protein SARC_18203, partial [Sphaeroforma arctica JP610]
MPTGLSSASQASNSSEEFTPATQVTSKRNRFSSNSSPPDSLDAFTPTPHNGKKARINLNEEGRKIDRLKDVLEDYLLKRISNVQMKK